MVIVEIPTAASAVIVAPLLKLIAVIAAPTEEPPDSISTPDTTPLNVVAVTTPATLIPVALRVLTPPTNAEVAVTKPATFNAVFNPTAALSLS